MLFAIPTITLVVMAIAIGSKTTMNPNTYSDVVFCGMIILFIYGYFIPTFIAYSRGAYHRLGIFLINLFLGATGFGYLFALLFAIYDEKGKYQA